MNAIPFPLHLKPKICFCNKQLTKAFVSNISVLLSQIIIETCIFYKFQSVTECYPPSERRLQLEALVARGVTPYLGFRGLYEHGHPEPVIVSGELAVAQQRRPSGQSDHSLLFL
jgi:hypothetical protein